MTTPTIEPGTLRCFVARVMTKDYGTESPDINAAISAVVRMTDDELTAVLLGADKAEE